MKKVFKEIRKLTEFEKDFKKLAKKFKTLDDDIETFINKQLKLTHKLGIDNKGFVHISGLGIEIPKIYKAKKFACKALKGRGGMSGIRSLGSSLLIGEPSPRKFTPMPGVHMSVQVTDRAEPLRQKAVKLENYHLH